MVKPIFIVKLPQHASQKEVHDSLKLLSRMTKLHEEYHVMPVITKETNDIEFEVLNVLNSTDIEIEELKNKVLKQLTQTKDEHTTTI